MEQCFIKRKLHLFVIVLVAAMAILASAGATEYSGKLTNVITWKIDSDDGILYIEGSGEMYNFTSGFSPFDQIPMNKLTKEIVISEGISNISDYAFTNCPNV